MSVVAGKPFDTLKQLLGSGAVITAADPSRYKASTLPWSIAYDKKPKLVLEPRTEAELQEVVRYVVQETELDFAVRGSGCGNSSAEDVVISMGAFKDIVFNADEEYLEVGAGLEFGEVDDWINKNAPEYAVVGSRCPFVGVVGSTLMGGLSWLSQSLGLGSDPTNLLDARIVLGDGRALWASSSPQLLWALRGGGGNFGVVTRLRLRAHRVGRQVWGGMITFSDAAAALPEASRRVAEFARRSDPALALHVFVVDWSRQALHGGAATPDLVLLPVDLRGEAHARSEDGFAWALDLPGADASRCRPGPLSAVHELQNGQRATHGAMESWYSAPLIGGGGGGGGSGGGGGRGDGKGVDEVDEHTVRRMWDWYVATITQPATRRFGLGSFALLEIMQEAAMTGSGTGRATAWPHAALGRMNVLQLGIGCEPASAADDDDGDAGRRRNEREAMEILERAPVIIAGRPQPAAHYLPNFVQPFNDLRAIYGENWDRLREVKTEFDPKGRFNKGLYVPPL